MEILNENVSVISESTEPEVAEFVVELLGSSMDIVQALDDEPNDVGGLTAAELKAKFDEGGNIIKTYINGTLIPQISDTVAEAKARAAAEAQRVANETARVEAEQGRTTAETARVAAETSRASAEALRNTQEQARAAAEAKRQSADKLGAADRILSNLTDPALALNNLGAASNPNLLDNWYFADLIDQGGGYVVPPDTPYYSDTVLTTQVGTVSAYTTATYVSAAYATITVGGTTYYVGVGKWYVPTGTTYYSDAALTKPYTNPTNKSFVVHELTSTYGALYGATGTLYYVTASDVRLGAVRGYVGAGYCIDRWKFGGNGTSISLLESGLMLNLSETTSSAFANGLWQVVDCAHLQSETVTLSVLSEGSAYFQARLRFIDARNAFISAHTTPVLGAGVASVTCKVPDNAALVWVQYGNVANTAVGANIVIKATKLELGSTQTLAHQENGKWVLNDPPPNKALELAKCQRYFRRFDEIRGYASSNSEYITIYVNYPDMRIAPLCKVTGRITDGADATIEGMSFVSGAFSKNSGDHIHVSTQWTGDIKFYDVWLDANL